MSDERKGFTIQTGGDVPQKALDTLTNTIPGHVTIARNYAPPVLVDTHGRVIRSPETEAEIAALKARIAELEGCATTPSTMSDILWALHAWNYVEHGHAHVSKQQPTPSQTMAMHRINDPRELAAILREQFAKRGIDAREPSEETPGNDGAFITVGPIEGADEDLIEIDRPEQCESFTMKQARKILAGLLVGMDPAETLGDSVGTLRTKPPQFIDINEHSYVAAHIDLDECVRCHGGVKTHPLISQDGSANYGEYCLACKCSWWNAFPVPPTPEMVRPRKTKAVDDNTPIIAGMSKQVILMSPTVYASGLDANGAPIAEEQRMPAVTWCDDVARLVGMGSEAHCIARTFLNPSAETWEQKRERIQREAFAKAKKIAAKDYTGWIFVPGVGIDGFFKSVNELREHCKKFDVPVPEFVWACTPEPLKLDADGILDQALEEHFDGARGNISDAEEARLQVFLDEWAAAQEIVSWHEDDSRAVIL